MGATVGREADALAFFEALAAEPYQHDFYRVMRRLECLFAEQPRWGRAKRPENEPIRLGQEPSVAFAPSSLASYSPGSDRARPKLRIQLFGLLGPNGPMPLHLTEYVRERERHHGDRTIGAFIDMLQHRFIALFYRAWAQAQPHVNRDRPDDDRFTGFIGAFFGISEPAFRGRDRVSDLAKLHHAGTLIRQVRSAEGLGMILEDYFGVPVRVREFVGHWMTLGPGERTRLSQPGAHLGGGAVLGGAVWDRQHKFRLEVGPLTLKQYEAFLPGERQTEALAAWVRMYTCMEFEWDVRLQLEAGEVPALTLGRSGRLGWTTWLGRRSGADASDLCLDVEAFEPRPGVRAA
jgi:type VI secretion system protein ImpH